MTECQLLHSLLHTDSTGSDCMYMDMYMSQSLSGIEMFSFLGSINYRPRYSRHHQIAGIILPKPGCGLGEQFLLLYSSMRPVSFIA